MPIEFGLSIPLRTRSGAVEQSLAANDRWLRAAAERDLTAWFTDHLQFADEPVFESLGTLAYAAGRYPGLRVGTLVLSQAFRNPALVAKAATLQTLTDGRFVLGIGAGANEAEHRAYGYPFAPPRKRLAQLAEAAQIIKTLWRGGPTSFSGAHYSITDAFCVSCPTPPPPLMIAAMGARHALRVVAAHADWWNGDWCTPDEYARKLAVLHGYCREIGRDPATITSTYYGWISVARDPARVMRRVSHGFGAGMHILAGTPDEVATEIAAFGALGVAHMQLHFVDHPSTEGLEIFLTEILPRFGDQLRAARSLRPL